ncbi:MAG: corrinoid protein [Fidelibacterota bacterium]|nr:MAG: corrinoid protein [Candidatus Neomarinimicrobiota bacterium]
MNILESISTALRKGDDEEVAALTQQAVDEGTAPQEILDDGLIHGMNVIGEQFSRHEIFLPDVLLAAKAMYAGMDILKPQLIKDKIPSRGRIVIGTVRGDLHDIGKNLVGIMLKGAGFEVIDLGKDVPAEVFIDRAVSEGASIIGMSALLTTTAPVMQDVTSLLKEKNLDEEIKTIIGGAPVTEKFAQEIGADAYAFDAAKAVECVKNMVQKG